MRLCVRGMRLDSAILPAIIHRDVRSTEYEVPNPWNLPPSKYGVQHKHRQYWTVYGTTFMGRPSWVALGSLVGPMFVCSWTAAIVPSRVGVVAL